MNIISYYYFYSIASFFIPSTICFFIDINSKKENKIANKSRSELLYQYSIYLPRVLFNSLILFYPFIYLILSYIKIPDKPLNIPKSIIEIIILLFVTDIIFYTCHYILHHFCYSSIHKIHHRVKHPIGISAIYMHWFDLYFGNLAPLFIPALLIISNEFVFKLWLFYITGTTVLISHSGFNKISNYHDYHHTHFKYNYGVNIFMDKLFGTYHK